MIKEAFLVGWDGIGIGMDGFQLSWVVGSLRAPLVSNNTTRTNPHERARPKSSKYALPQW